MSLRCITAPASRRLRTRMRRLVNFMAPVVLALTVGVEAHAQEAANRAAGGAAISKAPPQPLLPLPEGEGFPVDLSDYRNPLFDFRGEDASPRVHDSFVPPQPSDNLPQLAPLMRREEPPEPEKPPRQLSSEERRLFELASRIAPAVVAIRVWDEYGALVSSGVGSFVSEGGLVLTDVALVHPELAERVDYITTTAADGTNHRITGYYVADLASGVTLLQSEDQNAAHLTIKTGQTFENETPVHLLAVSEARGLVLADAKISRDASLAGQGWFNVKGTDSPGAVGSPVLDSAGHLVGIVGMQVPLKNWMNFALAPDYAAHEIRRRRTALKPLSMLPRHPKVGDIAEDPAFMDAFRTLGGKRVESAVSKLLALTVKYPRSAECWALLGLGAARLGANAEAVNCQRKAVALDPRTGLYWHQLAMAKLRGGKPDVGADAEDREALQLATEQRPGDKLAWLLLASRDLKDGRLPEADHALRQIIKLEPAYAQGFYLLAYVKGRLHDYAGAQAAIERCLELDPGYADAWYYRGLLLSQGRDHGRAAEAFRSATRRRPNHPQAWLNLAHEYLKLRRDTEARLAFREHQNVTSRAAATAAQAGKGSAKDS